MNIYRILVIGRSEELTMPIFKIFKKANFNIDYLSDNGSLGRNHPFINKFHHCRDINKLPEFSSKLIQEHAYHLIVVTDDPTIQILKNSNLSIEEKVKILPISSAKNIEHLWSKIGLANQLALADVFTPKFIIIKNKMDLNVFNQELQFPLIIKGDSSGGGLQTIKINDKSSLDKLAESFLFYPAIIQEYISGQLISIEAFYYRQELIFFNYSKVLKNINDKEFTPSYLRRFETSNSLKSEIADLLKIMGKTLGADGFASISCIKNSQDGQHYFFEFDLRPNVWMDYGKHWGSDAGLIIKNYFLGLSCDHRDVTENLSSSTIDMAYVPRMPLFELMINKYNCWELIHQHSFEMKMSLRRKKHQLLALINFRSLRMVISEYL